MFPHGPRVLPRRATPGRVRPGGGGGSSRAGQGGGLASASGGYADLEQRERQIMRRDLQQGVQRDRGAVRKRSGVRSR